MKLHRFIPIALSLLLSSCTYLTNDLKDEYSNAQMVMAKCPTTASPEDQFRKNYQKALADIVLHTIKFSTPLSDDGDASAATISSLGQDIEKNISVIYKAVYAGADESTRKLLDADDSDLKDIDSQIGKAETDLRKAAQSAFSKTPIGLTTASSAGATLSTLDKALKSILVTAASDGQALGRSFTKFQKDFAVSRPKISTLIGADATLQAGLKTIDADISQILAIVEQIFSGTPPSISIDPATFQKNVGPIINDIVDYEVGRLVMNGILRGSINLEHKLDQLDEKTWLAISAIGFLLHPGEEYALGKAVQAIFYPPQSDTFPSTTTQPNFAGWSGQGGSSFNMRKSDTDPVNAIPAELLQALETGLFYAACDHLNEPVAQQNEATARVDNLLAPFYWVLIKNHKDASTTGRNEQAVSTSSIDGLTSDPVPVIKIQSESCSAYSASLPVNRRRMAINALNNLISVKGVPAYTVAQCAKIS